MSDLFEPSQDPDGLDAQLGPFPRPDGSKVLRWHAYQNPRMYVPFLVEVEENSKTTLRFFLLDKSDAKRAHSTPLSVEITDGTRIYQELPSTAQMADPSDEKLRYGFLFLSASYIKELSAMPTIGGPVVEATQGTGKWPKGASMLANAVHKLVDRPDLGDVLSREEVAAIDELLANLA